MARTASCGGVTLVLLLLCISCLVNARDLQQAQDAAKNGGGKGNSLKDYGPDANVIVSYGSPEEEAFPVKPASNALVYSWWQWVRKDKAVRYFVLLVPGTTIGATTYADITALHLHVGAPRGANATNRLNLTPGGTPTQQIGWVETAMGWPILAQGILDDATIKAQFPTSPAGLTLNTAADLWNIIKSGQAYFNLHTAKFPAGEARGQVDWPKTASFLFDGPVLIRNLKPSKPKSDYGSHWNHDYNQQEQYQQDHYRQDHQYVNEDSYRQYVNGDRYRQDRQYGNEDSYRQDRQYMNEDHYRQDRQYVNADSYRQDHQYGNEDGYQQEPQYSDETYRTYRSDRGHDTYRG